MRWRALGTVGAAMLAGGLTAAGTSTTGENVGFSPKTVTVGEGDGVATVTVARDACENASFRLRWSAPAETGDRGTATPGQALDYTPMLDNRTWDSCFGSEGRRERVFTVELNDDEEIEPDETIEMSIGAAPTSTNQTMMPTVDPAGTIVIEDNDRVLTAGDVRVAEGAVATVSVERHVLRDEPIVVDVATADGTAKAGSDYEALLDDVTIPAGEDTATVQVPVRADGEREGEERFTLDFTFGESRASATVTVVDATAAPEPREDERRSAPPETKAAPGVPPAPGGPAVIAAQRTVRAPSAGRCISRRRFTVRLPGLARGTASVDGRRLRTRRRGGVLTAEVDLRGRRSGRYVLRVRGRSADGTPTTITRRYRTCAPRRAR